MDSIFSVKYSCKYCVTIAINPSLIFRTISLYTKQTSVCKYCILNGYEYHINMAIEYDHHIDDAILLVHLPGLLIYLFDISCPRKLYRCCCLDLAHELKNWTICSNAPQIPTYNCRKLSGHAS